MEIITKRDRPDYGTFEVIQRDVLQALREMASQSVDLIITSPPYYRKVDYGFSGQIGMEEASDQYLETLFSVGRELFRIAKPRANMFIVIQDTRSGGGGSGGDYIKDGVYSQKVTGARDRDYPKTTQLMIPERLRIGLAGPHGCGWQAVQNIIWNKEDSRRHGVGRLSDSYETIQWYMASEDSEENEIIQHYAVSAESRSVFDRESVLRPFAESSIPQLDSEYSGQATIDYSGRGQEDPSDTKRRIIKSMRKRDGALLRQVWNIKPKQSEAEVAGKTIRGIASFPLELAEVLVMLASKPGFVVLDPFCGMGTVLEAAVRWGCHAIGIDKSPVFCEASMNRVNKILEDLT